MEMSQGNSLCSYLKQTKNVTFFFYYKIRDQEGGTGPVGGGVVKVGGRGCGDGCGG
jgi:hypothetical protein